MFIKLAATTRPPTSTAGSHRPYLFSDLKEAVALRLQPVVARVLRQLLEVEEARLLQREGGVLRQLLAEEAQAQQLREVEGPVGLRRQRVEVEEEVEGQQRQRAVVEVAERVVRLLLLVVAEEAGRQLQQGVQGGEVERRLQEEGLVGLEAQLLQEEVAVLAGRLHQGGEVQEELAVLLPRQVA
jgi:hypothetical protein